MTTYVLGCLLCKISGSEKHDQMKYGWVYILKMPWYFTRFCRPFFFTGGQFWPPGIVVACFCVSVSLCVNHLFVRTITSVRTNHLSGCPRRVKTAQGRVKLTRQSSNGTSANFVKKNHNQPIFHETTATNSHSIRMLNSIPEAAILSLLVHMLSCAWWERSVHFVWSPAVNAVNVIELSNHGPVSRGQPVNGSTAHNPTTTFIVDEHVSEFGLSIRKLIPDLYPLIVGHLTAI